jgi:hypothetical protein
VLHNPSIETTKEMKRMLFLLKSLSSLLSSLTSSRVLFSLFRCFLSRDLQKSDSLRARVILLSSSLVSHLCLFRFSVVLRRVCVHFLCLSLCLLLGKVVLLLLLLPSSARGRHLIRRGGKQPRGGFRSRRRCPPPVMRSKRETNNEDKNKKISVITRINSV